MASLNVWMNGELVGQWTTSRGGTPLFHYAPSWVQSPRARALSLSMPLTADLTVRGDVVDNYFDNLLPDSPAIRRRIRERFGTRSMHAFDLLEAIGRDCVGAVQLLPQDQTPLGWDQVAATPLDEAQMEQALHDVAAPLPLGHENTRDNAFRISIAGAQEKTAFLSMGGAWFRPRNATATSHILKLPLGIVGNFRGDFSNSVENEWLCSQLIREFGLPMADTEILKFGKQTVLAVKRFDRRWMGVDASVVARPGFKPRRGMWIARLPQEDLCQATGRPTDEKYEAEGGPSIEEILEILASSQTSEVDRANFVLAQLSFWLLAATDGHAKNFSLQQSVGGAFTMTPLYDVLSAWTVIGPGANQLSVQNAGLAMSIRGKNPHYKLKEIQARHWRALASRVGVPGLWERMQELVTTAPAKLETVRKRLPKGFPRRVIDSIERGVRSQAASFSTGVASPPD